MSTRTVEPTNAVSLDLAGAAREPVDEVLERLASSEAGLTESEATGRLAHFGPNALPTRPVTAFAILLGPTCPRARSWVPWFTKGQAAG
jgi:hypothetical protein